MATGGQDCGLWYLMMVVVMEEEMAAGYENTYLAMMSGLIWSQKLWLIRTTQIYQCCKESVKDWKARS